MISKFPGDDGYGYDDYGAGRALTLEYLKPSIHRYNLIPFFPSMPSSAETGFQRGCIVLTKQGILSNKLEKIGSLQRYDGF